MEEVKKIIEFKEELTVEDLQYANYYNFKKQRKYLFNQVIFIAMSTLLVVMSIIEHEWVLLAVGAVLLIFSVFLFMPAYKLMIYNAVKKNMNETLKIKLSFGEDGFIYTLDEETEEETPKYEYNQIIKGVELPEYIYLYFSNSMIAIIKKTNCDDIEGLTTLLKEQLEPLNKYYKETKIPR